MIEIISRLTEISHNTYHTIMNYYYLAAGILSLILSVAHAIWGDIQIIPDLNNSNSTELTKIAFFIGWHQVTALLAVSGIALVLFAAKIKSTVSKSGAIVILCIVIANFLLFLIVSAFKMPSLLTDSAPQHVMFSALIITIVLGLRKHVK